MGSTSLAEELCFSELTSQRRCVSEATPPHRIVHVNAAWCECTGYTREEALQQTPMVLTGPETCPQTLQALREAIAAARPIVIRILNYRKDGSKFVSDLSVVPIHDRTAGAATHLLWFLADAQQSRVALPATTASHFALPAINANVGWPPGLLSQLASVDGGFGAPAAAAGGGGGGSLPVSRPPSAATGPVLPVRLHEALQHEVPYPQLVTERMPPYKIIHTNAAWRRVTGHGADELVGKPFETLLSFTDPGLQPLLQRAFFEGQQATSLATLRKSNGEMLHAPLTVSPLLETTGSQVKWFVHVLHVMAAGLIPPAAANDGAAPSALAAAAPVSLDWRDMQDALARASGLSGQAAAPTACRVPPRTGSHIELSALSELHSEAMSAAAGMGLSLQEKFDTLHEGRSSCSFGTAAIAAACAGEAGDFLISSASMRVRGANGAGSEQPHMRLGPASVSESCCLSNLSGTSPPEDDVASGGSGGCGMSSSNNSEAERAADALLAAEPSDVAAAVGTGGGASGSCESAGDVPMLPVPTCLSALPPAPDGAAAEGARQGSVGAKRAGPASGSGGELGVRLLTDSLAVESSSASSSSSFLGTLRHLSSSNTARVGGGRHGQCDPSQGLAVGGSRATAPSEGGSSGSQGRSATSPAHESADTLLRAAAHAAAVAGAYGGAGAVPKERAAVRVAPFLTKLYTIVDDPVLNEYATWCRDGTALRIVHPQRFADHCLPRFFKHNKLGSFQQQLLTYGFVRVPNDSCLDVSTVWQHPYFRRHQPELIEKIVRATGASSKRGASKPGASAAGADGAGEGTAEEQLARMQKHLSRLAKTVHGLKDELRAVRTTEMHVLDQLLTRVHKRFKPDNGRPDAEGRSTASDSSGSLTGATEALDSTSSDKGSSTGSHDGSNGECSKRPCNGGSSSGDHGSNLESASNGDCGCCSGSTGSPGSDP